METEKKRDFIVDSILVELGELGRFQVLQYFLFSLIVVITSSAYFAYVFTAGQVDYRCQIPGCDRLTNESLQYKTDWLRFAVPYKGDGKPAPCQRFQHLVDDRRFPSDHERKTELSCDEKSFNQSVIESCDEFVFAPGELTIVNEFNITCEAKEWQLALVGSLGFGAELAVQPLCAHLSDKHGRRPILIVSLLFGGICGIIKSLSVNYAMFATMEFLAAFVSGGVYMTIFIMAIESAGPTKRVFSGTLISLMFPSSQALSGVVAMMVPNFRTLLQVLYVPNLLILTFVWMVPESVRWLMVNKKPEEAKLIFLKAASMNNITLSSVSLDTLECTSNQVDRTIPGSNNDSPAATETFIKILQSRILAIRLVVNILLWFTMKLIYFGMTIQSVALAGDKYVNFIFVNAVEIPAILLSSVMMEWFGRKWSLIGSLLLTFVACIATEFIPEDVWLAVLIIYLTGKCGVTIAFSILYVYSIEQFPTSLRHSTINACYSIGTFGSILAPFTMLLISTWRSLPLLIFGACALLSSLLVIILPETKNTRLPDTIAEAEHLTSFMVSTANKDTRL